MTDQYIAYHVDLDGAQSAPIAVGTTQDECYAAAIANIAIMGCPEGVLQIQERPDVPVRTFEMLRGVIETYFARPAGSA